MGDARQLVIAVILLTSSVSSQRSPQNLNLSPFELALIRVIARAIPGAENPGGGRQEWTITRSISDETLANQQELEIIRRVGDAVPGDTNGGGGGADWSIAKSISREVDEPQLMDHNSMQTIGGGSFGGSVDGPLLRPESSPSSSIGAPLLDQREECGEGYEFVTGLCRMSFEEFDYN